LTGGDPRLAAVCSKWNGLTNVLLCVPSNYESPGVAQAEDVGSLSGVQYLLLSL
jgi:hypothetical protein